MTLAGKIALVIGGSRGIGAAITRRLSDEGATVVFTYRSRDDDAQRLAAILPTPGIAIRTDAADRDAVVAVVRDTVTRFGRIDILIHNAGLAIGGAIADVPDDAFDRVFALNVRSPFFAVRAATSAMPDGGRIILIGSIVAARTPGAGATLYAASKAALVGMTRGLARDLGDRAITVNLIQPGPIDTERNPADGPDAAAAHAVMAIKRHGTADEVAALVAYLASPAAAFVTGSAHNIDGGWSA